MNQDFRLSVEEKARTLLETNIANAMAYKKQSREELLDSWVQSSGKTFEDIYRDELNYVKRCEALVNQLRDKGDCFEFNGIPVFYLRARKVDDKLQILNTLEQTDPEGFLIRLETYFVSPICSRNVRDSRGLWHNNEEKVKALREKLETVLRKGFDKPLNSKIWMSQYPGKVFEYSESEWPKLVTTYDRRELIYTGGAEGYEWMFRNSPRDALACASVFIQDSDFEKAKKKMMPRKSKIKRSNVAVL